jgi:hypothetical protein
MFNLPWQTIHGDEAFFGLLCKTTLKVISSYLNCIC